MSSIHLSSLKNALQVIAKIGHGEMTFPVDGVPVTLRMLSRSESLEVYYYAKEEEENTVAFMERFRVDTLARAIVQIGDMDLRDVRVVDTGEFSASGKPVMVERHKALRQLVGEWSQPAMIGLFHKYEELKRRLEDEADSKIIFHVDDLKVEIARVEARLAMLQRDYEAAQASGSNLSGAIKKLSEKVEEVPPPPRDPPHDVTSPPPVHRAAATEVETASFDSLSMEDDAIRRENERLTQMRASRRMPVDVQAQRRPPHQAAHEVSSRMPPRGSVPLDEDSFFQGVELRGNMQGDTDPNVAYPANPRVTQKR